MEMMEENHGRLSGDKPLPDDWHRITVNCLSFSYPGRVSRHKKCELHRVPRGEPAALWADGLGSRLFQDECLSSTKDTLGIYWWTTSRSREVEGPHTSRG